MSAGKILNTSHPLYGNITRALSGDQKLAKLVALDGGADTPEMPRNILRYDAASTWTAVQGIARNSTNWFAFDTASIRKYDLVNNLLITNSSPFASLPIGINHLGDGFCDETIVYVAVAGGGEAGVALYNASDLTFNDYYDLSSISPINPSGCCMSLDGNEILVASYETVPGANPLNSEIHRVNIFNGSVIGKYDLIPASVGIQGIAYHNEELYVSSYSNNTNSTLQVYDGTFNFISEWEITAGTEESEGLAPWDGELYINTIASTALLIDFRNLYIDDAPSESTPPLVVPNALITNQNTILMKMTLEKFYNFNGLIDSVEYGNDWEAWVYSDGRISWRVNSGSNAPIPGLNPQQEYIFALTWDNQSGTVTTKIGIDGVYNAPLVSTWITPPAQGLWLGGKNASNNQGNFLIPDFLLFDKALSDAELLSVDASGFQNLYVADGGGVTIDVGFSVKKPVFSGSINNEAINNASSISFSTSKPVFSASIINEVVSNASLISFSTVKPVFNVAINNSAGTNISSVNFDVKKPVFSAAIDNGIATNVSSIDFSGKKPIFSASIDNFTPIDSAVSFTVNKPIFSANVQNGEVVVKFNGETNYTQSYLSTNYTQG